MKKQLRNGSRDKKIVMCKDTNPSEWTDKIYRYIGKFRKVASRFEEYLEEYKHIKI